MQKDKESEIDDIQSSSGHEELEKVLTEVFKVDTRYAIITALRMYGSLNIITLSKLLGKTESTIFHHLTEIQKFSPRIIEIDQEKTSQRYLKVKFLPFLKNGQVSQLKK
jgi:hypothetical protein